MLGLGILPNCRKGTLDRVSISMPNSFFDNNESTEEFTKTIHTIFSTGALLTPNLATWIAEAFGPVCQISFSGGTELCGSFVHGTRSLPSCPGEIAVKALGMDIAAFSLEGEPVADGESGELVCRKPFPNMPVMFWKDPKRVRYFNSYFAMFPRTSTIYCHVLNEIKSNNSDVWVHGDFIKINPDTKGIYVLGRRLVIFLSDGIYIMGS